MSEQAFVQSYKSVIDTFRAAPQSANASVYDNMFGSPVQHVLDVGDTLMHAERFEEKKPSPTGSPRAPKPGSDPSVQRWNCAAACTVQAKASQVR